MKKLKIDPEFRDKVPPLTEDERRTLEENILKDGRVLVPLITWNGIIVDGHNRYSIVQNHPEIPFDVVEREFADRYEAIVWICRNQLGRRNLTDEQKTYLIGKQYEAQKLTQGANNQYVQAKSEKAQNGPFQKGTTAEKIAKEHNVGKQTVKRAEKFAKGVDEAEKESPGFKEKILTGKISAPKTTVQAIPAMPKEERRELIKQIESGNIRKENKFKFTKEMGNRGRSKEMNELEKIVSSAVNDLYDTEKEITYTSYDLEEELAENSNAFLEMIKRSIEIRSHVLNEDGARERIAKVLEDHEKNIKKIRRIVL